MLKKECGDSVIWCMDRPTPADMLTIQAARCSHGKALVDCRRTCKKAVTLDSNAAGPSSDLRTGAYTNQQGMHFLMLGGGF